MKRLCLECGNELKRSARKYCSRTCQNEYQYREYLANWKSSKVDGSRGVKAKNLSWHLLRYLKDKYGDSCSICGWSKVNLTTGKVPLEIDHIDGNADNNTENNLRLICPNCHALTPSYRNLNAGNGRDWRRKKYLKTQCS